MFRNRKLTTLLYLLFCVINSTKINAQFNHTISAGMGFPNIPRLTNSLFKGNNEYISKGNGPFHLKYENRITHWFALGLNINYMDYEASYLTTAFDGNKVVPNKITIKSRSTAFNIRANFHLLNPENNDKWELYAGLGLGYKYGKFRLTAEYPEYAPKITLPKIFPFGAEITFGARYYIINNIGIYTEFGIAKSIIQTGIVGRF